MKLPSRITSALAAILVALVASASLATVPGQIAYQGLLLDDQGGPVNGTVDLVFTLFDAVTGGTQLWTETHDDVAVQGGVYDVVLGAMSAQLTPILVANTTYLEIAVNGETLSPRQSFASVPYAIEAFVVNEVGGIASGFATELFVNFHFDGGDPPNTDPREGILDSDGDGIANFLESDNDGDFRSDALELSEGTDINLPTPIVQSFSPEPAEASVTSTVTVNGFNFEPGLSVVFGSETPTPFNVTEFSFDVAVGPQPVGNVNVDVTLPNGEQDSGTFTFTEFTPSIQGVSPPFALAAQSTVVTITGFGFAPGLQVTFGSETPTPTNLTSTSFDVTVGPQATGTASIVVSYPSGNQDSDDRFVFVPSIVRPRIAFRTSSASGGNLGGLGGADVTCQADAAAASLPGTFLAWLSDGTSDPAARFDQTGGPFQLVNDEVVAFDWADLTDGTLLNPIDVRAAGGGSFAGLVWSNVDTDGTTLSGNALLGACDAWTSSAFPGAGVSGNTGDSGQVDSRWTDATPGFSCGNGRRFYCIEQ